MPHERITRRSFITRTAAGAALLTMPRLTRAARPEKLNIAVVGTQNQAWWNISQIRSERIAALCDVDAQFLARAAEQFPDANRHRDFREMIATEEDLDAVLIAASDHVHVPAAVRAMRRGLHVYCEKPLAHSVYEAREMARLANARRLATQMGTQIHAGENYRRVVELIVSGAIGPVREVHVWCGKSWSNGRFKFGREAPDHLDWDLWLGPAPERPYSEGVHPSNWRRFWEYGTGTLGDMACHYMDLVHWALRLRHPRSIRAEGPADVHEVGTPAWLIVHYEHPARDGQPPVNVTWHDGGKRPEILKTLRHADGSPIEWGDGQLFIGEDGMILSDYSRHLLLPEEKFAEFKRPEARIPSSVGHHTEWIQACRSGSPTTCNFDYSGALTEAVLLGNIAYRVGRTIQWDAESMRATNVPEAEALIRPAFREGWEV